MIARAKGGGGTQFTNANIAPAIDRFVREPECRQLTGLSRTTRWRLEREGLFPRRRKLSRNAVGWRHSELLDWLQDTPEAG